MAKRKNVALLVVLSGSRSLHQRMRSGDDLKKRREIVAIKMREFSKRLASLRGKYPSVTLVKPPRAVMPMLTVRCIEKDFRGVLKALRKMRGVEFADLAPRMFLIR